MEPVGHPAYGLDWSLVRSFEAVARCGSLAGGARLLGIAHPTIARHIQHLEDRLGTTLFVRSAHGLVINDAGERLRESAARMQASAVAFLNAADSLTERVVSRVRITLSELLAELLPHLALPTLSDSGARGLSVDMLVTNATLNLLEREADIALRHARPVHKDVVCRLLGYLPVGLFASRAYVAAHGLLRADNVAQHRFVDGAEHTNLLDGAQAAGLDIRPEHVALRSDALSCRRAAVLAGWGIGAFPVTIANDVDGLEVAGYQDPAAHIEVWLAARPEVRENVQLKQVFDGLSRALEPYLVPERPAVKAAGNG